MNTVQHKISDLRAERFGLISTHLALASNPAIIDLLATAQNSGKSIGGVTHTLDLLGTKIFVKKIRLTDLERLPENRHSTANLFELPMFYQYGIGSAGFGAWRELAVHTMTTNWVLTGECPNFPLMYHWRILPSAHKDPTELELEKLEKDVHYWDDSEQVRTRLRAILDASSEIVIFMEFFPETVDAWLTKKLQLNNDDSDKACLMVQAEQQKVMTFMNQRGLLHFDAHFKNILTEGEQLYFSDFGLAISTQFELSAEEIRFFQLNQSYDRFYAVVHLIRFIMMTVYGPEQWQSKLSDALTGKNDQLSQELLAFIRPLVPITLLMDDFFDKLIHESKLTLYPAKELELLEIELRKDLLNYEAHLTRN